MSSGKAAERHLRNALIKLDRKIERMQPPQFKLMLLSRCSTRLFVQAAQAGKLLARFVS